MATFSLSAALRVIPKWVESLAVRDVTDTTTAALSLTLEDGTGANQANAYWRDVITIAAGATTTVDLTALPLKAFGGTGTLSLAAAKLVLAVNRSDVAGVTFNGTATNRWATFIGGAATLPAGATLYATSTAAGWTINGTNKLVTITNTGSVAATVELYFVGVKT